MKKGNIIVKGMSHQKDMTIINFCELTKNMQLQAEIDISRIVSGNFNTCLSETDIPNKQKKRKRMENISTIKLISLHTWMGITPCNEQTECILFQVYD